MKRMNYRFWLKIATKKPGKQKEFTERPFTE